MSLLKASAGVANSPRPWRSCAARRAALATSSSASTSCRSWPTSRAPSAWKACSARSASRSTVGQLYTPQDRDRLMFYKEDKNGQILQEGINEAGAMCSWIAAATAYSDARRADDSVLHLLLHVRRAAHRRPVVGGRRFARARLPLLGGTAGRTTLNGEGLQHEDGHSHVAAAQIPNLHSLRPDLRLRTGGDHARRACAAWFQSRRTCTTTSP